VEGFRYVWYTTASSLTVIQYTRCFAFARSWIHTATVADTCETQFACCKWWWDWTGLIMLISLFLVSHYHFCSFHVVVLSWLPVSFLLHVKYTLYGQPPVWCWTFLVRRYDDVTGRQSICRRRTACLEQPSSCYPWSVTDVVNLGKAAENLFVCLRVAALVTYELAPWKCTD